MISSSPSREETLANFRESLLFLIKEKLKPYFCELGELHLKAAGEILEKSSRKNQMTNPKLWSEMTLPLKLLTDCERVYYSMSYLQHKRPRNGAIKYMYYQIPVGFKKVEEAAKFMRKNPKYESEFGGAIKLFDQVQKLVNCRLTMIALYQSLADMRKPANYQNWIDLTDKVLGKYQNQLKHPWLSQIYKNTILEVTIMKQLFNIQLYLSNYEFKDTMVTLTLCRHKLYKWRKMFITNKGSNSKNRKETIFPEFINWATKFSESLVTKASFYFYDIMQAQSLEIGDDFNSQIAEIKVNYYSKIQRFLERHEASSFNLILDCTGKSKSPNNGYSCRAPGRKKINLQGINCWPAVLRIQRKPSEDPLKHWPNIISIIADRNDVLYWGKTYYFAEDLGRAFRKNVESKEKYKDSEGSESLMNSPMSSSINTPLATPRAYDSISTTQPFTSPRHRLANDSPPSYSSVVPDSIPSTPYDLSRRSSFNEPCSNEDELGKKISTKNTSDVNNNEINPPKIRPDVGGVTYLINRIESRMYLVVIFLFRSRTSKRKDTKVKELTDICTELRLSRFFAHLRPKNRKTGTKKK